jgi:hypothetical protein
MGQHKVRLLKNLFLRRTTCRQFVQKLDAQARPADARLAAENLRIGDDQLVGDERRSERDLIIVECAFSIASP